MTDQEQQRADHLALVAAPILAAVVADADVAAIEQRFRASVTEIAIKAAEALQRAAEERVKG